METAWAAASLLLLAACGGRFADDTTGLSNETSDASTNEPGAVDAGAVGEAGAFGDAGLEAESPPPPPQDDGGGGSTSGCSAGVVDIQQTGQTCTTSEKWSCGSEHYAFTCSCPPATCECWHDGVGVKLAGSLVQCPGCVEAKDAIAICGFPH
jgi:hypothetical protein